LPQDLQFAVELCKFIPHLLLLGMILELRVHLNPPLAFDRILFEKVNLVAGVAMFDEA
jgi:hypothetical protein